MYNNEQIEKLAQCGSALMPANICIPATLKDRLLQQKGKAEAELARVTELLQLLENNPETERILQLMGNGMF